MDSFARKYEPSDSAWLVREGQYKHPWITMNNYEALFALANGYLGMRGINEDMPAATRAGTYLTGVFDKSECVSIEWVNLPNPIPFYLVIDGEKIDIASAKTNPNDS